MNVLTEYRVRPDQVSAQLAAIREYVDALQQLGNPGIKFTAYQLPDEVSFRHVIFLKDEETAAALMAEPFYKALGDGTLARCEQPPSFTPMTMVATFKVG